jgi:hypothetical protein
MSILPSKITLALKFKIVAIVILLWIPTALNATEYIFNTDTVRYAINDSGINKSLYGVKGNREWLSGKTTPFSAVRKNKKIYPVSRLTKKADLYYAEYGLSDVKAVFRISTVPSGVIVKLDKIIGEGVDEVILAQLKLIPFENNGWLFAVSWNDEFAVSLMALSDRVHTRFVSGHIVASVYPEFGMENQQVAIIAAPTARFLNSVQKLEHEFNLPSPMLGGLWAKNSPDVKKSYLFTDLTEANANETINYAKLAGFKYIMLYSGTWASTNGSYQINKSNFPRGEESLKAVIDKCHAAGLKVGMHMLTSFVSKNDPLVRPRPDTRLLKDAESILTVGIDEKQTEIMADVSHGIWPRDLTLSDSRNATDIQIDDEIIHYRTINIKSKRFLQCIRGARGTKAASHKAGAKIYHLAERHGSYLVDLRSSLKDELADRVAGLINRCGFDMIYLDGGEVNSANGPAWYWVSQQQISILDRVKRELLVQGSGMTHWTWHLFTRGTCDDYAAISPKDYLDYHKIPDYWEKLYKKSFFPSELGWWGFLEYTPSRPATTPDEAEFYAIRMLATDAPVSLETNFRALKTNGRTTEILKLLGKYEQMRLSGVVPVAVRQQLKHGEWHLLQKHGKSEFKKISYESYRFNTPESYILKNSYAAQPLSFRLQTVPRLAAVGDVSNIQLFKPDSPLLLKNFRDRELMPGTLIERINSTKNSSELTNPSMVDDKQNTKMVISDTPLDLTRNRALAVRIKVSGALPRLGEPVSTLNVQLEDTGKRYRDHYIDINFIGERTVIIPESNAERMLKEFRPAQANYSFKKALSGFDYKNIIATNLRWMRKNASTPFQVEISRIEALSEQNIPLKSPAIVLGKKICRLPITLKTGDYAEYWSGGPLRVFNRNGVLLSTINKLDSELDVLPGENHISLKFDGGGSAKFTAILLGQGMAF